MKKIKLLLKVIMSIPKTVYFNFRVFDLKTAFKLPVLITNNVKIQEIYKGCVEINNVKIKPFMIMLGISGTDCIDSNKGLIFLNKKKKGKIIFKGKARFSEGIKIYNNSGISSFGNNFIMNKNGFIASDKKINFGNDVLIGWNVSIRDSDGHKLICNNKENINCKEVNIGNHVWICSCVDVLKGNNVGENSVIAYRSCLTGKEYNANSLIGGYPGIILKSDINWEK